MTSNHAPAVATEDLTRAISGHPAVLPGTQPARLPDAPRQGGFARDFATADGQRVMVAALNHQQFADLARAAGLASTFAFLECLLGADFSRCGDLYANRAIIAKLLAPWFARRTVAQLSVAFARTSVPWAILHNVVGRPGSRP
jgi:crotonobetainyl-CoA:carnitine CoA-transferase CaiB-like acyl-CoA transferase